MPLYEYRCPCGFVTEAYAPMARYRDPVKCGACGGVAERIISAGYVVPDIEGYKSMVDGRWIGGRAEHKEHLRVHNLVEVGNEHVKRKEYKVEGLVEDIKRSMEGSR